VAKVETALREEVKPVVKSTSRVRSRKLVIFLVGGTAALVGGLLMWQLTRGPSHDHAQMVRVFAEFIETYEQGQTNAANVLVQRYSGTPVTEIQAARALRRQTVARQTVLANHQVSQRYLLKMPCCDCVQTVYACNGRISLVLFEHEQEELEWFDERPAIRAECRGRSCCLIELKNSLAATWQVGGGYVTVVGVRDVSELSQLVDELQPD
jgi:hypothetical protein